MLKTKQKEKEEFLTDMIRIYICILVFITSCTTQEPQAVQKEKCKYPILLDHFGLYHSFDKAPDTVIMGHTSATFGKVILLNCMGEIEFEEYSLDSILLVKGSYQGAKDTVQIITYVEDLGTDSIEKENSAFYEPVRTGKWQYFDKEGNLLKEENYVDGHEIRTNYAKRVLFHFAPTICRHCLKIYFWSQGDRPHKNTPLQPTGQSASEPFM